MSDDDVTMQRQLACDHRFIKPASQPLICVHCGVTETRLAEIRNQAALLGLAGAWPPPVPDADA